MRNKLTKLLRSLVLILLLALSMIVPIVVAAPPHQRPPTEPGPRPPSGGGSDGSGLSGGGADSAPLSAIYGTVTDLSSGQFGAGIAISISGAIVRTDGAGRYSITGQHAGEYSVALQLSAEFQPAQEPVIVYLDGQNSVIVDLAYYSQPPPAITLPSSASPSPATLPETGASWPGWLLMVAGLWLIMMGWILLKPAWP